MSEGASLDILGPYFSSVKIAGTGGSGTVFSAVDTKTEHRVALKRLSFQGRTHCRSALRELKVQKTLEHENIVKLLRIVDSEGKSLSSCAGAESFKDTDFIYTVQEFSGTDLHHVIHHSDRLPEDYIRLFLYQLLRGLKYVHSANVLHRDIKPSNLLIDTENLLLKIGDFGLTRVLDSDYDHRRKLSECASSLWYKAPELMFNSTSYDSKVDMWGAGCVLGEMLRGKPLFEGKHEMDQMELMLDTVAVGDENLNQIMDNLPEELLRSTHGKAAKSLRSMFEDTAISIDALDLLEKLLQLNPEKRLTAEEALAHPFLQKFACPSDEPICLQPLHIEDEVDNFPQNILKDMVFDELMFMVSVESCESQEVIEKADATDIPEKEIMSLKEAMVIEDAPIPLREYRSKATNGDPNISSAKLDQAILQQLGLQSHKEGLQTLTDAMKIQKTFKNTSRPLDEVRTSHSSRLTSSTVIENILGKNLKENLNFTCKKNALAGHGPFGMCYL